MTNDKKQPQYMNPKENQGSGQKFSNNTKPGQGQTKTPSWGKEPGQNPQKPRGDQR